MTANQILQSNQKYFHCSTVKLSATPQDRLNTNTAGYSNGETGRFFLCACEVFSETFPEGLTGLPDVESRAATAQDAFFSLDRSQISLMMASLCFVHCCLDGHFLIVISCLPKKYHFIAGAR